VPSKEEYERVLNRALGVSVRWRKLSLEELVQLATVLSHPEVLLERLGARREEKTRGKLLEAGFELFDRYVSEWEGPLAKLARRVLGFETGGRGKSVREPQPEAGKEPREERGGEERVLVVGRGR